MRTFIAVDVPEEVKARIEDLQAELPRGGLLFVKKPAMHITLQFLGEKDEVELERVKDAMQGASSPRFRVSLTGLSYFSPEFMKVIFAKVAEGSSELQDIYYRLCDSLAAKGIAFEREKYVPHLTIARVKHVSDRRELLELISRYEAADLGSFEADAMVLEESALTPEGPVYKDLYKLEF